MEEFLFYHSYSKLEFISYALFAKLKPDYTVACYNFQSTKEKKNCSLLKWKIIFQVIYLIEQWNSINQKDIVAYVLIITDAFDCMTALKYPNQCRFNIGKSSSRKFRNK